MDNDPIQWIDPEGLIKFDRKNVRHGQCNSNDRQYCRVQVCKGRAVLGCYTAWHVTPSQVDDKGKIIYKSHKKIECNCEPESACPNYPMVCAAASVLATVAVLLGLGCMERLAWLAGW